MDVRRFEELKREVETKKRERDKAEGALFQLLDQLKNDWDVADEDEADDKLVGLSRELEKMERRYDEALEEFEKKWKSVLEKE